MAIAKDRIIFIATPENYFPELAKYIKKNHIEKITINEKTADIYIDKEIVQDALNGIVEIKILIYDESKDMTK